MILDQLEGCIFSMRAISLSSAPSSNRRYTSLMVSKLKARRSRQHVSYGLCMGGMLTITSPKIQLLLDSIFLQIKHYLLRSYKSDMTAITGLSIGTGFVFAIFTESAFCTCFIISDLLS